MRIFPPKSKKYKIEIKWKEKDKESYIFIVYTMFNINWHGLLAFFDDELTTFRNENYSFLIQIRARMYMYSIQYSPVYRLMMNIISWTDYKVDL